MKRALVGSTLATVCWVFSAHAGAISLDITVSAGKHERKNVPVHVQVPSGQVLNEKIDSVTITAGDGKSIPAQWTEATLIAGKGNELHFVLPHLAAGETIQLKATISNESSQPIAGYRWHDQPGKHTKLLFGDRPIVSYHYER